MVTLHIIAAKTSFYFEEKILNKVLLIEQSMEQLKQLESYCNFFAAFNGDISNDCHVMGYFADRDQMWNVDSRHFYFQFLMAIDSLREDLFDCMNQVFKLRWQDDESASDLIVSKRTNVLRNVDKVGEIFADQLRKALPLSNDP